MRHTAVERWSRGSSFLHRRDARVKILALLVFLVSVAGADWNRPATRLIFPAILVAGILAGKLPAGVIFRAALVLPFCLTFAAVTWISGDPNRAVLLIQKSFISAWAALLLVATTPLPQLLRGLESLGAPAFLLMVAQFTHRYLFVIAEQAHRMRLAGLCRGGFRRRGGFRAAAGALGVLFALSYERAERIHRSMISRGFQGHFRLLSTPRMTLADAAFLCLASAAPIATAVLTRIAA